MQGSSSVLAASLFIVLPLELYPFLLPTYKTKVTRRPQGLGYFPVSPLVTGGKAHTFSSFILVQAGEQLEAAHILEYERFPEFNKLIQKSYVMYA